jgi:hypothetical protein
MTTLLSVVFRLLKTGKEQADGFPQHTYEEQSFRVQPFPSFVSIRQIGHIITVSASKVTRIRLGPRRALLDAIRSMPRFGRGRAARHPML